MTRFLLSLAAASAIGALAAGCGGGDDSSDNAAPPTTQASTSATSSSTAGSGASSSSSGSDLKIAASEKGGLSFTKKTLTAQAGTVTITMGNPSADAMPHGVAIEGNGVDQDGNIAQPGGTSKVSVKLKPGTYTFYCPVGSHRQAGMEGTLTVQ